MKTINQMFQENGEGSMMRALAFLLVCAGIFVAVYPLVSQQNTTAEMITLSFGLIGSGLTGKIVQKGMEIKIETEAKTN